MLFHRRSSLANPLSPLLLAVLGCGGLGLPGGGGPTTPPPAAHRVVNGEVAWVDSAQRELEVHHRTGRVVARYDVGPAMPRSHALRGGRPDALDSRSYFCASP